MNKKRRVIGYFIVCTFALLVFVVFYFHQRPPLFYYTQSHRCQELPTRLIRPAFKHIVNRDLPTEIDELRALFRGGRVEAIYIRFKTDPNSITDILDRLGISSAEWETYDTDKLRYGVSIFPYLSVDQERLGVYLFDQDSVESGRLLRGVLVGQEGVAYAIFIDDQNDTVYMRAYKER